MSTTKQYKGILNLCIQLLSKNTFNHFPCSNCVKIVGCGMSCITNYKYIQIALLCSLTNRYLKGIYICISRLYRVYNPNAPHHVLLTITVLQQGNILL